MSKDRRGFRYALEPLQKMTQWALDESVLELATHNTRCGELKNDLALVSRQIAACQADLHAQMQPNTIIDPRFRQRTFLYLQQLEQQQHRAQQQLQAAEQARDAVFDKLVTLRRKSEGLQTNREDALALHDQQQDKLAFLAADESWLQRRNGGVPR